MDTFVIKFITKIWNSFGENKTPVLLLSFAIAVVFFSVGFYTCLKLYIPTLDLSRVAQNTISPPTNKEEDLSDIVKKLTMIESDGFLPRYVYSPLLL